MAGTSCAVNHPDGKCPGYPHPLDPTGEMDSSDAIEELAAEARRQGKFLQELLPRGTYRITRTTRI